MGKNKSGFAVWGSINTPLSPAFLSQKNLPKISDEKVPLGEIFLHF